MPTPFPADFKERLWAAADQRRITAALHPSEHATPVSR
ncbi:uncharacterized protein SOCE836_099140 [Sorangium cellulosum]|uniref:Transposase n=1 Tax=Sorangium cellulosum TaxID=56 RepID=A0A4P2R3P5_SORCE|nr:uncharacterized protein SOCE836_099140 [Sorangium cellulosum]